MKVRDVTSLQRLNKFYKNSHNFEALFINILRRDIHYQVL